MTLFTLQSYPLFGEIASAVMSDPAAFLTRKVVEGIPTRTSTHRVIRESLLAFFDAQTTPEEKSMVSILGNKDLKPVLATAAELLRNDVRRANEDRFGREE